MGPVKMLALAGATALVGTAAVAADFPSAPPPLMPQVVQAPPVDTGGWYLRGDVGVGIQRFSDFSHHQTNPDFVWPASWRIDQRTIADTTLIGFGVGFAWNSWLRFDVTAEHRASAKFKVLGSFTEFCPFGARCFDLFDGFHSANVFLANAYLDLGTWWCVTPFIGGGIGTANNRFDSITDIGFIADGSTGFGFSSVNSSTWNLAWAAHAGLAYTVTPNFKVEFAYRFLSLGSPNTQVVDCNSIGCMNTGGPRASFTLNNFTSQDFKIGMRWMLQPEQVVPAPVYAPPLMRRG